MAGAMSMSSNIESYENQINQINPSLCDLYNKILSLNNYLMFTKENLDMTDENKMQLGTAEVSLGMRDEKPKIESQGVIFPVLLSESIRGFLELFISHGLPKNRERATSAATAATSNFWSKITASSTSSARRVKNTRGLANRGTYRRR